MLNVNIYTDGACRGNPDGPGGYGTILEYRDDQGKVHIREASGGYSSTTNNRMELLAVIIGLEMLKKPCLVQVCSDSKYIISAFNEGWIDSWLKNNWKRGKKKEPVKNRDLWERLLTAKEAHQVNFVWVKGHAGHPMNERCDELATTAADSDQLSIDLGKQLNLEL